MSESDKPNDPWSSVPQEGAQPAGGPPPGYGYPPPAAPYYYAPYPPRRTNGMAVAALVCGICGFIYLLPGILGIVFGSVALRQIRRDGAEGRGMAIAGIATGATWIALYAAIIILVIVTSN